VADHGIARSAARSSAIAASTAVELAARYDIQMPIAEAIQAVVDGKASPIDAYRGLLRRPPGHENDPE